MCLDGVWGRICSYGWDTTDSYVACKEMGYPGTDIGEYTEDCMNACVYRHHFHNN